MYVASGIFIIRLVVGLTMLGHGSQKLFGWFGGNGFAKTAQGMRRMGFRPGWLWASFSALGEVIGGALVALGFLTQLGAAALVAVMFVATVKVHLPKGFWNGKGGIEYPLNLLLLSVALGLIGPGSLSLDAAFPLPLPRLDGFTLLSPLAFGAASVLALLVVLLGFATSKKPAAQA